MSPKVVPNEKLQNWMLGTGSLFGFAPSLSPTGLLLPPCHPSERDIKGVIWAFWPREGSEQDVDLKGRREEGKWKERKREEGE